VLVFGITANGDVAPLRTLAGPATGLDQAWGIAVDAAHDEIFVANADSVTVYSRTASGNAPPLRQIDLQADFHPVILALDASQDELYASGSEDDIRTSHIEVYPRTGEGMVPPLRTIDGPSTGLGGGNGISINPARPEFLVANFATNSILAYAKSASGDAAPLRSLSGPATTLDGPLQVALDAATDTIVTNQYFSSTINVYARSASGDTAPLRTIAGPATGLLFPVDLAVVRRSPP
jgi:DNA-binding beta-propeller fold protein YncE